MNFMWSYITDCFAECRLLDNFRGLCGPRTRTFGLRTRIGHGKYYIRGDEWPQRDLYSVDNQWWINDTSNCLFSWIHSLVSQSLTLNDKNSSFPPKAKHRQGNTVRWIHLAFVKMQPGLWARGANAPVLGIKPWFPSTFQPCRVARPWVVAGNGRMGGKFVNFQLGLMINQ